MQTITAAGAADIIAFAWYRLGYRPRESVLLVGLHRRSGGGGGWCGAVVRIDIPAPGQRAVALDRAVRSLANSGHHGLFALLVSDRAGARSGADSPLRRRRLARAVRASGRRVGLDVLDVIGIDESRYASYLCRDERCCPPEGHPLAEALSSRAAAAMVTEGMALRDRESDLVADVEPVDDPMTLEELDARPHPTPAAALALWGRLVRRPEQVDGTTDPCGMREDLVDVCNALDDVRVRDAVLASTAGPLGRDGLALGWMVLRGQAGAAFTRLDELEPDDEVCARARQVLAAVARVAPPGRRADALAVLGWLAWWQGGGATARLFAERALADVADHRLAGLVQQVLTAMVPPAWVERSRVPGRAAPRRTAGMAEW